MFLLTLNYLTNARPFVTVFLYEQTTAKRNHYSQYYSPPKAVSFVVLILNETTNHREVVFSYLFLFLRGRGHWLENGYFRASALRGVHIKEWRMPTEQSRVAGVRLGRARVIHDGMGGPTVVAPSVVAARCTGHAPIKKGDGKTSGTPVDLSEQKRP
ncbi:MAG: hypothetical protein KBD15_00240 [Candidatus Magasanikbacteria bacterium]|jgi:hypothetical protein|nr:hypothetical protein [Candidatus Magasanikbacteria bacterium]